MNLPLARERELGDLHPQSHCKKGAMRYRPPNSKNLAATHLQAHPTHARSRSAREMNAAKKTDVEHVCASVGCEKEGSKRCGGCKKVCVAHAI
jgi:hypothetical protein